MTASETFDYVIAGGGSAGCLIAARLIEQGCSVCLVEAGTESSELGLRIPAGWTWSIDDPSLTWRHQTEPVPSVDDRSILIRQGRVTGGTSAMNGLVYVRGQAADYDGWRDTGLPGWGWSDVLPFFQRVERYGGRHPGVRGQSGQMAVTDNDWSSPAGDAFVASAQNVGLSFNPAPNNGENEGVSYYERMISRGWRTSGSYVTFLRKYRRHPKLQIVSRHLVEKIDIEDGRAIGLTIRASREAPPRHIAARIEVVLASGTFGTPAILLRSGVGPTATLAEKGIAPLFALEGVGQNFQDHFSIRLIARTKALETLNHVGRGPRLWLQIARWLMGKPSIVSISPGLACAFIRSLPESPRADSTVFFSPGIQGHGGRGLAEESGITSGVYALRPESRGTVGIRSRDPFDTLVIQPNYLSAEIDRRVTVGAFRKARDIFASEPLTQYIVAELTPGREVSSDEDILAFSRATGVTSHHPVGTARMGSDKMAVVDHELRVIGIDGLRIADASVMPLMPSGNTLAPTFMIAERAADFLDTTRRSRL
jgi:choline dehydrogenase